MMTPQRRTYYGARWYIVRQLERDVQRMAGQGYAVASQTWIPGVWFLPAVTLCLIVIFHLQVRSKNRTTHYYRRTKLEPCHISAFLLGLPLVLVPMV